MTGSEGKKTETSKLSPLSRLVVEEMDTEQIWAQLELVNKPLIKFVNQTAEEVGPSAPQRPQESSSDDEAMAFSDQDSDGEPDLLEEEILSGEEANVNQSDEEEEEGVTPEIPWVLMEMPEIPFDAKSL